MSFEINKNKVFLPTNLAERCKDEYANEVTNLL